MHTLLVKVQHKLLDEKVDDLIATLAEALPLAHEYLSSKGVVQPAVAPLLSAMHLLLDVLSVQKDFLGYFIQLPALVETLTSGVEVPTDEHHQIYQQLKAQLLKTENQKGSSEHNLAVFARFFPLKRPFFEPYFLLWAQMGDSNITPSARVLERLVYGILNLVDFMVEERLLHPAVYKFTATDNSFLLQYNQNRVLKIDEALVLGGFNVESTHAPTQQRIACINCGSYAPLQGYRQTDGSDELFMAYGFSCAHCGFQLFDQKDLLLAGIKTVYSYP